MSRSYKKNPAIQYAPERGKYGKRQANKLLRRSKDVPDGKAYKKFYCSWNIHDCRSYYSWESYWKLQLETYYRFWKWHPNIAGGKWSKKPVKKEEYNNWAKVYKRK